MPSEFREIAELNFLRRNQSIFLPHKIGRNLEIKKPDRNRTVLSLGLFLIVRVFPKSLYFSDLNGGPGGT